MPSPQPSAVSRRALLVRGGAGVVAATCAVIVARDVAAQAIQPGAHLDLLNKLVGGKPATPGKVKLRLPEIAENGNTVPLTVSVDNPMTAQNYVKAIHIVTDNNPRPEVLTVRLSPLSGKAEVSTRIRLASTMNVISYAELSDGTVWSARSEVKVTIGGCGG